MGQKTAPKTIDAEVVKDTDDGHEADALPQPDEDDQPHKADSPEGGLETDATEPATDNVHADEDTVELQLATGSMNATIHPDAVLNEKKICKGLETIANKSGEETSEELAVIQRTFVDCAVTLNKTAEYSSGISVSRLQGVARLLWDILG